MLQKIRNGAIGIFALGVVSILVGINFKLTKIARRFMNNPDELIRYGIETEQHAIDVCNKLHEVYPTMTLRKLYANLNTMEIIGINMQIKGFAEKDKIHMTDEIKQINVRKIWKCNYQVPNMVLHILMLPKRLHSSTDPLITI